MPREEAIIDIFERNTNSVANIFDITLQVVPDSNITAHTIAVFLRLPSTSRCSICSKWHASYASMAHCIWASMCRDCFAPVPSIHRAHASTRSNGCTKAQFSRVYLLYLGIMPLAQHHDSISLLHCLVQSQAQPHGSGVPEQHRTTHCSTPHMLSLPSKVCESKLGVLMFGLTHPFRICLAF